MNQIQLIMSLPNLGLTPDPPVRTLFAIFICLLTSSMVVLVFWGLKFFHQRESSPKLVDSLHSFGAQNPDFPSNFQNWFHSYSLTFHSFFL